MSDSMGTKEAADKWGCSQDTVAKWCREGKIEGVNQDSPGSPWHIPQDTAPPKSYKRREKK